MQQIKMTVMNSSGLHTRPAAELARLVKKYTSVVKIVFQQKELPAQSALCIMAACIGPGSEIAVTAEGTDEAECVAAVEAFIKGLNE